eukprot:m.102489 g.102489  ORF g.102489 m.102489 type:complete len:230 (-) comp15190_c0_seq62:1397-2086(-)
MNSSSTKRSPSPSAALASPSKSPRRRGRSASSAQRHNTPPKLPVEQAPTTAVSEPSSVAALEVDLTPDEVLDLIEILDSDDEECDSVPYPKTESPAIQALAQTVVEAYIVEHNARRVLSGASQEARRLELELKRIKGTLSTLRTLGDHISGPLVTQLTERRISLSSQRAMILQRSSGQREVHVSANRALGNQLEALRVVCEAFDVPAASAEFAYNDDNIEFVGWSTQEK